MPMSNNMGGKLLFAILSGFMIILSSASADNLIANPDFYQGISTNALPVAQCVYNPSFFPFSPTCTATNDSTSNSLPTSWIFNQSFDALRIKDRIDSKTGQRTVLGLFMYTVSNGEKFTYNHCGYTVPLYTCSGTNYAGNLTFNPSIQQNITLPNSTYQLNITWLNPFKFALSSDSSPFVLPFDDHNGYYNCGSSSLVSNCSFSDLFRLQLFNATSNTIVFDQPLGSTNALQEAGNGLNVYSTDLAGLFLSPGIYTVRIILTGSADAYNSNEILINQINLSVNNIPNPGLTGDFFIRDINTFTGIGIVNWTQSNVNFAGFT